MTEPPGVIAVLGPPLAGKSTLVRELCGRVPDATAFSVRSHFEPRRRDGQRLPPVGTMLPDDVVIAAVRSLLSRDATGLVVLDGFPGSAAQVDLLRAELRPTTPLEVWWLALPRAVASDRARARRVCVPCDGGVNQAEDGSVPGRCTRCGTPLTCRPDDDDAGFTQRWRSWHNRAVALRHRIVELDIPVHQAAMALRRISSASR